MSIKKRKYNETYLGYGFTSIVVNNEERPQCVLCSKVLSNDSMRPAKLIQHLHNIAKIKKKPISNDEAEL